MNEYTEYQVEESERLENAIRVYETQRDDIDDTDFDDEDPTRVW